MVYETLVRFTDKKSGHVYEIGDTYPRSGRIAKARLEELSSNSNALKRPIIKEK